MSTFIINATNTDGDKGTIYPDVGFQYNPDNLNVMNEAEIKISGLGTIRQGLLGEGSIIEIYRDGTLEFKGDIINEDDVDGGGSSFQCMGSELKMSDEKGAYTNSPYTTTASATIAGDIIGESSHFSAGTVEAGSNIDFRARSSNSLLNELRNLVKKVQQDIGIDYANMEIDVLDHKGSTTSVATLNDKIDIAGLVITKMRPKGNKVIVYGKGDGAFQIESTYPTYGQDATSQAKYGVIEYPYPDRSVMSLSEANILADAIVAITGPRAEIYDFNLLNPNKSFAGGDVITLNAPDRGIANTEVRIVGITRGIKGGEEFLSLQVTNKEIGRLMKRKNMIIADMKKAQRDSDTYMEGGTNYTVWGGGINAKTSYPLKVGFSVSDKFVSENGSLNVSDLLVSYDVDKYNKSVGAASFTGSDPQVKNDSGGDAPAVEDTSETTEPDVEGTSEATAVTALIDGDSVTNTTLTGGSWDNGVCSIAVDGTYSLVFAKVRLAHYNGANTPDILVKLRIGTSVYGISDLVSSFHAYAAKDLIIQVFPMTINGAEDDTLYLDLYSTATVDVDASIAIYGEPSTHTHGPGLYNAKTHTHGPGLYNAVNHTHPDGSYDINSADLDHVSIGDDVSEAGSVNATSVNIYLDFWNTGTSNWDNKHSVMATAKTIDRDVDISDSGTYPDAAGFWRIRVEPITATPDYVQAKVEMKYTMDS